MYGRGKPASKLMATTGALSPSGSKKTSFMIILTSVFRIQKETINRWNYPLGNVKTPTRVFVSYSWKWLHVLEVIGPIPSKIEQRYFSSISPGENPNDRELWGGGSPKCDSQLFLFDARFQKIFITGCLWMIDIILFCKKIRSEAHQKITNFSVHI